MGSELVTTEVWAALGVMIVLLVGAAIAAISFNLRQHGKLVSQFRQLGEKYDLELTIPERTMGGLYRRSPTLYGRYQGHELSIYPKGYGLDNTRQTDIAVRMTSRCDQSLKISLTKRSLSGKLGQVLRGKEVRTGDAAFDQAFSIHTNNAEQALQIFNAQWRQRVKSEWPKEESFLTLDDGILTQLRFGLPYDDASREGVERMVDFCADLSEAI